MTTILWVTGTTLALGVAIGVLALVSRRRGAAPGVDIWTALDDELERARRYDHAVALIRLSTTDDGGIDPTRAAELPTRLRASDRIAVSAHDAVVVAPETDPEGATRLAGRLCAQLGPPACDTRIACFPHDALTRHALLQAVNRARTRPTPRRRPRLDERRAM